MNQTIRVRHLIPFMVGLGIFWIANAEAANEQRCTELGANCVCSEPMNTNSWVEGPTSYWNPADTNLPDLECNDSGVGVGVFMDDGSGFRYQTVNSGEAITNLPATHKNTWVLRTLDNGGGQFVGTKFPANAPTARRSIRFYKYYSSNYGWVGGACLNGNKLGQINSQFSGGCPTCVNGPVITETAGTWSFYGIESNNGYNQSANGCCSGPGPGMQSGFDTTQAALQGKWVRYEFVVRNAAPTGPGTVFEFYRTIVTPTTGTTYKYVDSSVPTTFPNLVNWTSVLASTLHPIAPIDHMVIDWFRNGTCSGFAAISHFVAAAWSTDAGQMIGAAKEIEGGVVGGDTTPPAAPVNLRVSMLAGQ